MPLNFWTEKSIEAALNYNYLDQLFKVYPISQELVRELNEEIWNNTLAAFNERDNKRLIYYLMKLERFPIKDSYISFLRNYPTAVDLNPSTIDRIAGNIYETGLDELRKQCTLPKEANTRIGPMFSRWLYSGALGCDVTENPEHFLKSTDNIILKGYDKSLKETCRKHFNYSGDKGIDLVAKFNNKFVIGEAKFITSEGGNQRNQIRTTRQILDDNRIKAFRIAIFDGVIYLPSCRNLLNLVCDDYTPHTVLSSLYLRDFLYSL